MAGSKMVLRPFDPKKDKPVETVGGSHSTEYLVHDKTPDGDWIVYPTIWFNDNDGSSRLLSGDMGQYVAKLYEQESGKKFPRFKTEAEAGGFAKNRSAGGGATRKSLIGND